MMTGVTLRLEFGGSANRFINELSGILSQKDAYRNVEQQIGVALRDMGGIAEGRALQAQWQSTHGVYGLNHVVDLNPLNLRAKDVSDATQRIYTRLRQAMPGSSGIVRYFLIKNAYLLDSQPGP